MKSTNESRYLSDRPLIWLAVALGFYIFAYGYQLIVDFMFIDDYAVLAGDLTLFDIKGSGRWLLYHFLNFMSLHTNLDPTRIILLRITSLLIQLVFFALLFFYLLKIDFGCKLSFAAVLFLASMPQVQIFSVWLIALPSWCALTLVLAAVIWLETTYDSGTAAVYPAWASLVAATLASLLTNQTVYLFGAGLLVIFWMRRALYGLPWVRFAAWSLFALCTSIALYGLLLTVLEDQLGYTGAKQEYLNLVLSGKKTIWVELSRVKLGMVFHVFNSLLSENSALIIWLPSLYFAIIVVLKKTSENAVGSKRLALAAPIIALLFLFFTIYIFLLIVPYKDSHRLYFPATVVVWAFFMLALSIISQHIQYQRLFEHTVILISLFSLYSASMAVYRGIIQPSVLELNYVRESLRNADLLPDSRLYMRMPEGPWIEHPSVYMSMAAGDPVPMRPLPNTGLYWYRLSSRWNWVPNGMLRYVLKELDVANWNEIEVQFGRHSTPAGFTTIDMRHLKDVLKEAGSI